jgi:hypothetical protein
VAGESVKPSPNPAEKSRSAADDSGNWADTASSNEDDSEYSEGG